jgi:SOS-response transcriptional repressor LexA
MNEERLSKKQQELLTFIDGFIKSNGYGPSYREVMRALDYRSVSTVAVHVDGLITRGLLRKKDNSARSLEVVSSLSSKDDSLSAHEVWLQKEIANRARKLKANDSEPLRHELAVLQEAAIILGLGSSTSSEV